MLKVFGITCQPLERPRSKVKVKNKEPIFRGNLEKDIFVSNKERKNKCH